MNEPAYSFGSADNARTYPIEVRLLAGHPTSAHAVVLDGRGAMIVGAGGGCSAVHARSAVAIDDRLYLAVGDHIACLSLSLPHRLVWATQVDVATCFGILWDGTRAVLISHGELEIARLSLQGEVMWTTSGADIFTGVCSLQPDHVAVVDFNETHYRLDYETGMLLA
ncbi:hypothetical protein Bsp3421_001111 [Burkholderia sp. FERM BP-3421]|jgi:hypothetical protein|uniref:hypothetical protein n=1 Tax=Burkholderia sp. FERM BP-3421 TaxID=1494466 RepID=UPI00235FE7D4|nr:hypothetical protein [Burkholderia sp. FERM BP-3421]WDD91209.1 hypothetical protein Bsp3421_001111 [Burkholderia sp. FERM BP-3421]